MNPEQQKKEVSDLKFSDFSDARIKFDHDAKGMFGAMGIENEEIGDIQNVMTPLMLKSGPCASKMIEAVLEADCPTKWKVCGLFKAGEAMGATSVVNMLMENMKKIPDGTPGEIVKAHIMLSLLGGS